MLKSRPDSAINGSGAAAQIQKAIETGLRHLEDGPVGGTPIRFGDDIIGFAMDAPISSDGSLNLFRISDASFAQVAYQMTDCGLIWLPGINKRYAIGVPFSTVTKIGKVGPYHMDVNADTPEGGIRGPFKIERLKPGIAATYPVLWSHNAKRERSMEFEADSEGLFVKGRMRLKILKSGKS